MSAVRLLTLSTSTSIPQARVLAASLHRHNPGFRHEVVLIGQYADTHQATEFAPVVNLAATGFEVDVDALIACHDERELVPLVLPRFLAYYTELIGGPVLHLPPTVWVTGDLRPVADALSERGVVLASRTPRDPPDDGLTPTASELEHAGRISDAVIGIDGCATAQGFLAWWAGHLERMLGSLDGSGARGRPEDRPWLARMLELAPARFGAAVLNEPGCNTSAWNLHGAQLRSTQTGFTVDGRPLRFMDMAGFEPNHPYRLNVAASRVRVSRSAALHELCAEYAAELLEAGWRAGEDRHEIGRQLANGLVYDDVLSALHARARIVGENFEDLFSVDGTEAFTTWLQGPAPRGGVHGITRYVFYRVLRERPDVMRAYPDLEGADGAEYVAWCQAFGREELTIPELFMPVPPPAIRGERVDGRATGEVQTRTGNNAGRHVNQDVGSPDVEDPVPSGGNGENSSRPEPETVRSPGRHGLGQIGPSLHAEDPSSCPAVRVSGYLSHALGLGSSARAYVRGLKAAGVTTSAVSVPQYHMGVLPDLAPGYGSHDFEDVVHEGGHNVEIVAVNPEELPSFVARLGEDYFHGPRIGIWAWETNVIPPHWQRAYSLVQEIWVNSNFMAQNLGAVTSVPVVALPPPVQLASADLQPLRLGVPDGFMFLFVFDYLSTIQRKNPVGLIEAFKRAFAPGDGPQLLIKTINAPLRPLAEEAVLWASHGRTDVHVVDRSLSAEQRDALMATCDCYVSLHRSEGFGLTLAEAMALGKPAIATGYSGNLDFMTTDNSYLVDYDVGRVGPDCEIYPADGEWAEPSIEHAADLMRHVWEHPEVASGVGARAREDIARMLSPEATGAAMRARLEEVWHSSVLAATA